MPGIVMHIGCVIKLIYVAVLNDMKLKDYRPHLRDYLRKPSDYRHTDKVYSLVIVLLCSKKSGSKFKPFKQESLDKHTHKHTNIRTLPSALSPRFAVDKKIEKKMGPLLSLPVQFVWLAHVCHFLSVCLSGHDQKSDWIKGPVQVGLCALPTVISQSTQKYDLFLFRLWNIKS